MFIDFKIPLVIHLFILCLCLLNFVIIMKNIKIYIPIEYYKAIYIYIYIYINRNKKEVIESAYRLNQSSLQVNVNDIFQYIQRTSHKYGHIDKAYQHINKMCPLY